MDPEIQALREKYGIKVATPVDTDVQNRLSELDAAWGTAETPEQKAGLLPTALKKTFTETADKFGKEPSLLDKASIAGTLPLRVAGATAGALGEAISEPIADVAHKVFSALRPEAQADLQDFGQKLSDKLEEVKSSMNPEIYKSLSDIVNVASFYGGGKGAGAVAKEVAPVVGKTGEVVSGVGRGVSAVGEKLYGATIKPDTHLAELEMTYKANNPLPKRIADTISGKETTAPILPSETAARQGVAGTEKMVGIQAERAADKIWSERLGPQIKESPAVLSKEDLFSPIEKRISETAEPSKRQAYQEAYEAIKEDYRQYPELFNLDQGQALKRGLDEFTPEKLFKGKNVANEYKVLANDMANAIRQKTYEVLPEGAKKDFIDWGNLQALRKIGIQSITEPIVKVGGFGTLVHHLWNIAAIPITTVGGKVLYKVGNVLQFLGKEGEKTFGSHLKNLGFETPKEVSQTIQSATAQTPTMIKNPIKRDTNIK